MNLLSRVAVLITVTLAVLAPLAPASAATEPAGGLIVIPGTGNDLTPLRLRTSAGCPAGANAFYATMKGHGFPPDGQVVTQDRHERQRSMCRTSCSVGARSPSSIDFKK